jgi:hypothetical protein
MAFNDFYITNNGSNLNSGSTSGASAAYTSSSGNWDGTSIFTPTDGSTPANTVNVNDFVSIYNGSPAGTAYVAQVTAVGAGVNGTITVSTTVKLGTAPATNSGSMTCKDGGSWNDFGIVATLFTAGTVGMSTRVNIKAATYANTNNVRTFAMAGAATTPLQWRGYQSTIGDQDGVFTGVAGTNIPSITFTSGGFAVSATRQEFWNLDISCTTATASLANGNGATNISFVNCRFTSTSANASAFAYSTNSTGQQFIACYFNATSTATSVINDNGGNQYFFGCYLTGGGIGINAVGSLNVILSIIDSTGNDAIKIAGNGIGNITNCTINAPGGNGVSVTTAPSNAMSIANCVFRNVNVAAKAAINNTSGTNTDLIRCIANSYYNCTSNTSGLGDTPLVNDQGTLASDPIQSPSTNFALNSVAFNLAYPGIFPKFSAFQGYLSPGAVQPPLGGGAGSVTIARGDLGFAD